MKTSELTGAALDWAVAKCENSGSGFFTDNKLVFINSPDFGVMRYQPTLLWAQGGPIIERMSSSDGFRFEERPDTKPLAEFYYDQMYGHYRFSVSGDTPLIAAMRCYVASKLGDDVEIPNELL
jgi:hypothetical protein